MRDVDPSIATVVCGSSFTRMPEYTRWDPEVLGYLGGVADCVSLYAPRKIVLTTRPHLSLQAALPIGISRTSTPSVAACRHSSGAASATGFASGGAGQFAPHMNEEVYNLEGTLVVADFPNSFIRNADLVRIANLAQAVSVLAPVMTRGDELLVQSIHHAFRRFSSRRDGVSLKVAQQGPNHRTKPLGEVPLVDASVLQPEGLRHVFVVSRSTKERASSNFHPRCCSPCRCAADPEHVNRHVIAALRTSTHTNS